VWEGVTKQRDDVKEEMQKKSGKVGAWMKETSSWEDR
jgi:hypothetical protein